MATVNKFAYPEYYDFPPFFTCVPRPFPMCVSIAVLRTHSLACSLGRLQPVRATREKQLVLWKQLILEYHRTHNLPLFQPLTSTLFENVKISRTSVYGSCTPQARGCMWMTHWLGWPDKTSVSLSLYAGKMTQEGRLAVAEYLIRCGNGSWEDDTRTRCRIMWKKPAEWAAEIYDFVRRLVGTVWCCCSSEGRTVRT